LIVDWPKLGGFRIGEFQVCGDELLYLGANVLPQQLDVSVNPRFRIGSGLRWGSRLGKRSRMIKTGAHEN
jgi:hypothetical protein